MVALLLGPALPAAARDTQPSEAPLVGAYLWGGLLDQGQGVGRFQASAHFLLKQGFQALRIAVSANTLNELGVDRKRCGEASNTSCYLEQVLDSPAFDDTHLRLLMVTLHETASRDVLSAGMDPARQQAISTELRDVLGKLQHRFQGRPVKIVLSNWEGDNMVYCGSVFRYARQADFAAQCDTTAADGVDRRLARFVEWMQLRDSVVAKFRAEHPDLDVEHAPEFNLAYLGPANCRTRCDQRRTVFEGLARAGHRPLCSFSSCNSTNRNALAEDLKRLLASCDRVILGELGFAEARQGGDRVRQGFTRALIPVAFRR
jgi:hypothetical protein